MLTKAEQIETSDIGQAMLAIGQQARAAARILGNAPAEQKNDALKAMAGALRADAQAILDANVDDVADTKATGTTDAFIDRLTLNPERLEGVAAAVESIAALDDPVGSVMAEWTRPNGLRIERARTPLGVVGVIYESRPNVTADAGSLCLKAGNAAILRGGSDSYRTSAAIHQCLVRGLKQAGLPEHAIQIVPTRDRDAVGMMLAGLDGAIDVIVPRGGKSLVGRVQQEARVPVFAHLEGICHLYIHEAADVAMATEIAVNAKMRRTGICGAAETILIDRSAIATHLKPVADALSSAGCALRGDAEICAAIDGAAPATEEDWSTEYLDAIIAIKVVDGVDAALDHIARYGSSHTESIITEDAAAADRFLSRCDSAIVMHNASTQYADGGEFGMGAEIGIATGRMHARGPVGVEQLTSFKYRVHGSGQIRP